MAATVRRHSPGGGGGPTGGGGDTPTSAEEDIAAIAKQISDTAEVIYQNWKSRNLAPADLITCHGAGDSAKLGSMLQPASPGPAIDLLAQAPSMDNNRLETLVKNFVHEDKQRLAAAAAANKNTQIKSGSSSPQTRHSPSSSIQFALQKFERNHSTTPMGVTENGYGSVRPLRKVSPPISQFGVLDNTKSEQTNHTTSTPTVVKSVSGTKQAQPAALGPKPQISPKPVQLFQHRDTIEMTLPPDLDTNTSKVTTGAWLLKNRLITTDHVAKKTTGTNAGTPNKPNDVSQNNTSFGQQFTPNSPKPQQQHVEIQNRLKPQSVSLQQPLSRTFHSVPSKLLSKATIDEVALEEKRLINALKNGDVLNKPTAVINKNLTPNVNPTITAVPSKYIIREPEKSSEGTPKWTLRSTPKRPEQQVPHPELTTSQKQHLRQSAANPVRPFLTRGSVAERVLIFERCPSDLLLDKRVRTPVPQVTVLPRQAVPQAHTTLQRHVKAHRNVNIPRFHYPTGKPAPPGSLDLIRTKVKAAFVPIGERASREDFAAITKACQLPLYWKTPLYLAVCADKGSCTYDQFMTFWQSMSASCHDAASRFIYILSRGRRNYLIPEDFIPLVQDVVETHPGLIFLKEATEFHSRYVHTVIARIFYCVNRSWSAKISIPELRRSNLLNIIQLLEEEEDINQITQYFSYEHFYVIYCKFWELDRDHDLFIDKQDLMRHNDHALSSKIIDRIFSGCVTRGGKKNQQEERMSYTDFVWFLLSEEDKLHPTAIEYWFRCMDLDGDGYISMYELEYFYEEQMQRMESIGIETLPFQDCLCQMLDMVKPKVPGKVSLSDLKKCKMTPIFFDTFFNLEKYLDHEQRDPFASQRDHDIDGLEMSDWDRYAAEEYELLVAEEGGNDANDSISSDEAQDEDLLSQHLDGALELSDESDCSI